MGPVTPGGLAGVRLCHSAGQAPHAIVASSQFIPEVQAVGLWMSATLGVVSPRTIVAQIGVETAKPQSKALQEGELYAIGSCRIKLSLAAIDSSISKYSVNPEKMETGRLHNHELK